MDGSKNSHRWLASMPLVAMVLVAYSVAAFYVIFEPIFPEILLSDVDANVRDPVGLKGFDDVLLLLGSVALSYYSFPVLSVFVFILSTWIARLATKSYTRHFFHKAHNWLVVLGLIFGCTLYRFILVAKLRSTEAVFDFLGRHVFVDGGDGLRIFAAVSNTLMLVAAWYSAIAFCTLLLPHAEDERPDPGFLLRRIHWCDTLLYILAALIVAGVFSMGSLYSLPSAWLGTEDGLILKAIAGKVAAFAGLIGSLFLACMYLPTHFVLRHRASELAYSKRSDLSDESAENWLTKQGFASSYWGRLPTIFAILGPTIAGAPLQKLLARIYE